MAQDYCWVRGNFQFAAFSFSFNEALCSACWIIGEFPKGVETKFWKTLPKALLRLSTFIASQEHGISGSLWIHRSDFYVVLINNNTHTQKNLNAYRMKTFKAFWRHHTIFTSDLLHSHNEKLHWGFVPGCSDFMMKPRTRKILQHFVDKGLINKMQAKQVIIIVDV